MFGRLRDALFPKPQAPHRAYSSGGYGDYYPTELVEKFPRTTLGLALASTVTVYGGRCMIVRMSAVNGLPWRIKDVNDKVITESRDRNPKHPLARAIHQVYKEQLTGFFSLVEQTRCLYGETFVEKGRDGNNVAAGLYCLNNLAMQLYAPRGVIEWYQYSPPGGGMVKYSPQEIAYGISTKSPVDDFRGVSPMELALNTINLDHTATQFLLNYWQNMARPGLIVSPKQGEFTDDDADKMKRWIKDNLTGVKKAGKPLIVPRPADFQTLDIADPDKQSEANNDLKRNILVAFGVPPAIAGDTDGSRYQESDENIYWFYTNTIIPECDAIAQWINAQIMPFFDTHSGAYFEFDTAAYDRVAQTDKDLQSLLEQRFKSGAIDYYTYQMESGNDEAAVYWKGMYWNDSVGALVPASEMMNVWKYKLLIAPSVYNSEVLTNEPLPQPVDPNQVIPTDTGGEAVADPLTQVQAEQAETPIEANDPTKDLGEPLFIGLSLADNPDIIGLQKEVMSLASDPAVKWTHPNDYHVTLLHAPAADETVTQSFLEAVKELPIPELRLKMGSLYAFDRMGKHALTSLVRRNQALLDYQAQVYDLAQEFGIQCQSHYAPAEYKPHVTLAYIPEHMRQVTYQGKVTVTPRGVNCVYGGEPLWKSWEVDEPTLDPDAMTEELKTFARFAKIHGAIKAQRFEFRAIPASLGDAVKGRLSQGDAIGILIETVTRAIEGDYDAYTAAYANTLSVLPIDIYTAIKAVIDHYAGILAAKAITDTRARFEAELTRQMLRAYNEKVKRSTFERNMGILLNKYAEKALYDGFADAGYEDFDIDDTEDDEAVDARRWLDGFLDDQAAYISNVADVLYADDAISEQEVRDSKGELWFTGSVQPAYNYALTTASKNARLKWVFDPAKEHCRSCETLNGIVLTAKRWQSEAIEPGSRELDCWGGHCGCRFEPTKEKKFRGKLPRWKFKALLEHAHSHA